MPRDRRLDLDQNAFVEDARSLGAATALPVRLSDEELCRLASIVFHDTGHPELVPANMRERMDSVDSYFDLSLAWFSEGLPSGADFVDLFMAGVAGVTDFRTYFGCLCGLHKRRMKYATILEAQPLPTMLQVAPRALLEFGILDAPALASWITWRKWFFDIDNRAGQETGYLFEPILTAALGGKSFSAKKSPVKRLSDANKGRQVDCVVDRTAYEFKLRVTIAASGQGRFGEELAFAADCHASNFAPVLMVLDPTPSARLDDLERQFRRFGGRAFIGDEAWAHLEDEAGEVMSTFIEKYVRRPIREIDEHSSELLGLSISAVGTTQFSVTLKNDHQEYVWHIPRREDIALDIGQEDESQD